MVNYGIKKTLLFLGLKYHSNLLSYCSNLLSYCSNLLSYCSNLPPFQGKFNVINIPMVIYSKMTVNYCGICFIRFSPDVLHPSFRCCRWPVCPSGKPVWTGAVQRWPSVFGGIIKRFFRAKRIARHERSSLLRIAVSGVIFFLCHCWWNNLTLRVHFW